MQVRAICKVGVVGDAKYVATHVHTNVQIDGRCIDKGARKLHDGA